MSSTPKISKGLNKFTPGLFDRMGKAIEIAEVINNNGPLAVQAILKTIRETEGMHENEAFKPDTANGIPVFLSEDAKEGPRAFKEKRAPNFQMK